MVTAEVVKRERQLYYLFQFKLLLMFSFEILISKYIFDILLSWMRGNEYELDRLTQSKFCTMSFSLVLAVFQVWAAQTNTFHILTKSFQLFSRYVFANCT